MDIIYVLDDATKSIKTSRNTIERDTLTHPLLRDKKQNFIPFKFQTISALQQSTPK